MSSTRSTIIIGDINTYFGPFWGSKQYGPFARKNIISSICSALHLNHIVPAVTGSHSHCDHIFAKLGVNLTYSVHPSPFSSDHNLLSAKLTFPAVSRSPPAFGLERYNLRALSSPRSIAQLRGLFKQLAPEITSLCVKMFENCQYISLSEKQEQVNSLDLLILSTIQDCSELALGKYSVNSILLEATKNICFSISPLIMDKKHTTKQ